MKRIAVIDYGMGNLDSVLRAVEETGAEAFIAKNPEELAEASNIILPGVGCFADGMNNCHKRGLDAAIRREVLERNTPLLGICLGMQLLADTGYERDRTAGLGLIRGEVRRFDPKNQERIPHIGWNEVHYLKESSLFDGIPSGKDFYFVHSYHFCCADPQDVAARTSYCENFVSVVIHDNIYGVQFHPEKSLDVGLKLIANFIKL